MIIQLSTTIGKSLSRTVRESEVSLACRQRLPRLIYFTHGSGIIARGLGFSSIFPQASSALFFFLFRKLSSFVLVVLFCSFCDCVAGWPRQQVKWRGNVSVTRLGGCRSRRAEAPTPASPCIHERRKERRKGNS